ncbi:MAG: hypothetical protein KBC53_11845, partial [Nitrosomonas sp.]|nr:hypothetical protein [Nitrosomonas sp.]
SRDCWESVVCAYTGTATSAMANTAITASFLMFIENKFMAMSSEEDGPIIPPSHRDNARLYTFPDAVLSPGFSQIDESLRARAVTDQLWAQYDS